MRSQARQIVEVIEQVFPFDAPPNLSLVRQGSYRDTEVLALERAFRGKDRWPDLQSDFLDDAPEGWASALSFFSDEAAAFYLPAYLVADLRGELQRVDPVFYLTHGLDGAYRSTHAKRGRITPQEQAQQRWRLLEPDQCAAVAAYLRSRSQGDVQEEGILLAVELFWDARATAQKDR